MGSDLYIPLDRPVVTGFGRRVVNAPGDEKRERWEFPPAGRALEVSVRNVGGNDDELRFFVALGEASFGVALREFATGEIACRPYLVEVVLVPHLEKNEFTLCGGSGVAAGVRWNVANAQIVRELDDGPVASDGLERVFACGVTAVADDKIKRNRRLHFRLLSLSGGSHQEYR